ncbi:MAG TPA: hypothetical protein PK156_40780 [Polyangium sp.]|nr:hypothetical protein [Polyangium sp.]
MDRTKPWPAEFRGNILRGNDDEDVHIVPVVKWRLRAAGLTHTHVPNGRSGELGFPSAKRQGLVFLAKSEREENPAQKAWWIGRACHVLGDVAVPARAQRVWHLEGDPLEAWIEGNLESLQGLSIESGEARMPATIFEDLARAAAAFAADTTRTPWGRAVFHWFGRGTMLDEQEIKAQAQILIPLAVQATEALLKWVTGR